MRTVFPRSLRARLTLGVTLILAAVLAVAGTLAYRSVAEDERAAVDDRLIRTAELSKATALAAINDEVPQDDARLDAALNATRSSLRLLLGEAPLLETGDVLPAGGPPLELGMQTFEAGGVRYRAYVTTLRDPALAGIVRLEVTTRLTTLDERLADQRRTLFLLGMLALLLSAAGTWGAASLVLRPLARLRAATTSIAHDEDLGRRVVADDGAAELRALADSFNAMLAQLEKTAAERERALAATRRFTADAGHELRTPLTSVQATLSSLARHPELDAERRTRMATEALTQQQRLVSLLDGLQALARGDAAPAFAPVDLAEVVDASLMTVGARYPDVAFRPALPAEPVVVDGWDAGLRSLVDNLLENAARHGGRGGHAVVRVGLDAGALVVEDDGPGVPEADRGRIFEPFARAGDGDVPGSGLGLALVAQQARLHGMDVAVDASPELGGARFTVHLRAV